MSRVPGPHWSAAPSQTLGTFKDISGLFFRVCLLPRKKRKTTLYLSSVKSHFFSSPRGSQAEPRHAFPMKRKSAVSKLHATSRQIKALITATKLEGGEWLPALDTRPHPVVLTPYNSRQQNTQEHSRSRCFGYMHVQQCKMGYSQGFKYEHGFRLHVKLKFRVHFELYSIARAKGRKCKKSTLLGIFLYRHHSINTAEKSEFIFWMNRLNPHTETEIRGWWWWCWFLSPATCRKPQIRLAD